MGDRGRGRLARALAAGLSRVEGRWTEEFHVGRLAAEGGCSRIWPCAPSPQANGSNHGWRGQMGGRGARLRCAVGNKWTAAAAMAHEGIASHPRISGAHGGSPSLCDGRQRAGWAGGREQPKRLASEGRAWRGPRGVLQRRPLHPAWLAAARAARARLAWLIWTTLAAHHPTCSLPPRHCAGETAPWNQVE